MYSKSDLARRGFLLPELENADSGIIQHPMSVYGFIFIKRENMTWSILQDKSRYHNMKELS